ncbi:hypothetical protein ES708_24961 [subsurface metagenome]
MNFNTILIYIALGILGFIFVIGLLRSIRIIPAKTALIVERLGKYHKTLEAGFHVLFPFIDKVRYKHNLKEMAIDVPAQTLFKFSKLLNYEHFLFRNDLDEFEEHHKNKDDKAIDEKIHIHLLNFMFLLYPVRDT